MKRYFIDTCVLIWLIAGDKRVKKIASNIELYQGDYAVPIEVLMEFINLSNFDKLEVKIEFKKLLDTLKSLGVEIYSFDKKHLKYLNDLPAFTKHTDPIDRSIIAHAIADKRILISGDGNFSLYENAGLMFLEV